MDIDDNGMSNGAPATPDALQRQSVPLSLAEVRLASGKLHGWFGHRQWTFPQQQVVSLRPSVFRWRSTVTLSLCDFSLHRESCWLDSRLNRVFYFTFIDCNDDASFETIADNYGLACSLERSAMSQDQLAPLSIPPCLSIAEDSDRPDVCDEDILTLWTAEFQDDPLLVEPCRESDFSRLQGAWITTSGKRQAELLIAGHHLTVHFGDGDIYMGSFTLGTSGRLTTLDVRVEEGPPRHQGLPVLCICELDGDTLHWCNASPGEPVRPTAFDDRNPHLLCLMFRREHRA